MDKFPEAFERFEKSEIDLDKVKDSNELIRKFRYWNNVHATTHQQDVGLRKIARERGIRISRAKGISERKGVSRESLKRRYIQFRRKGKVYAQARDYKGRFVKK
jgi:hypothetical protein